MGHNPPQQCCIKLSNVGTDGPLPHPRRPPPITWCNVGIVGWDLPRMQPSLSLCVISTHISTIVPTSQLCSSRIKLRTGSDTPPPPWFNPVETILTASSNQKSPKLKTAGVVVHASRAGARKAQWPISVLNGSARNQSSYLSKISQIVYVEKKLSCGEILGNFGEILGNFGKF